LCVFALGASGQDLAGRQLVNIQEVHREIRVAPEKAAAVRETFPSFLEYQDMIMFHPRFGYYGTGRVNFISDYQTFPNVLAPYFGHMIAEQILKMYRGMRAAGTLGPDERFTIAEFGGGNGRMAESILEYIEQREKSAPEQGWREFGAQVQYVCYDISPSLNKAQKQRNARFGSRFDAREADATAPTATIPKGSLKGVFLSNELPDAFSVHKVILSADGKAEVAFVVPFLHREKWERFRKEVPEAVAETIVKTDRAVREKFFDNIPGPVYLTRATFSALLDSLVPSSSYEAVANSLEFREAYVDVAVIPELAAHLRRYARLYATELARYDRGVVTYVNLGVEKMLTGFAEILKAGYVLTLDYGADWKGIIAQDSHPHFRTYGPGHIDELNDQSQNTQDGQFRENDTYDAYRRPTLTDMTTDVNFSLMAAEGRLAGLTTLHYSGQFALRNGTGVLLETPPPDRQDDGLLSAEFANWANSFETDPNYRLMVQQKAGTDPKYVFPADKSDPLESDEKSLSEEQRQRLEQIEKKLRGSN
jgi:SAM-dependent MidA family methyltransferase